MKLRLNVQRSNSHSPSGGRFFSHHGSISYKYWIQKVGQVFCVLKVIQEHNQEMPLDSKNIIEI